MEDSTTGIDNDSSLGLVGDGLSSWWHQQTAIDASLQACTPTVDDEHVYVGDMSGTFYALSRETGSVRWRTNRAGALSDSSPCYRDGRVYVGSGGGDLYAFGSAKGTEHWMYTGSSAITSSPTAADGAVYVGRNDGHVLAIDAADGSVRWQTDLGEAVYSRPAHATEAGLVYATTRGGVIHALDSEDGSEVWSNSFGAAASTSAPVVDDRRGVVYLAASEVLALDATTGSPAWSTSFYGACGGSAPAFDGETVYAAGGNGHLYAIEPGEGVLVNEPLWELRTWDVSIIGDVALGADSLVTASLDGGVYVIDQATGETRATVNLPCQVRSAPVVVDEVVYVAGCDGRVVALKLD